MKRIVVIAFALAFVVWLSGCATVKPYTDKIECHLDGGKISCEFAGAYCEAFPDEKGCKDHE